MEQEIPKLADKFVWKTSEIVWRTIWSSGSYGDYHPKDFEELFLSANSGIARRECAGCDDSHKVIFLKRKIDPAFLKAYQELLVTFSGKEGLHMTYDLYGSQDDMFADKNPWQYCGDCVKDEGFPGTCGPSGPATGQWTGIGNTSQPDFKFEVLVQPWVPKMVTWSPAIPERPLGALGDWGPCSVSCGSGTHTRQRLATGLVEELFYLSKPRRYYRTLRTLIQIRGALC